MRTLQTTGAAILFGLALSAPPARAAEGAFVWPVNAYIGATEYYRWGQIHSGSADLYTQYGIPVLASREGTAYPYWSDYGGKPYGAWGVYFRHGNGYTTSCGHLVEKSPLVRGQKVRAGQVVGYNGRTGMASTPHVHFTIRRYGSRLAIPGIKYGQWVTAGRPVPGVWNGLPRTSAAFTTYAVRVLGSGLAVRSAPRPDASRVEVLAGGTTVTVTGAQDGWYRIGLDRWIPWSGTTVARFNFFGVQTTRRTTLRMGPGTGYAASGSLDAGAVTTVFEVRNGGWYKILYTYPTRYRWLRAADTVRTERFRTKVCVAGTGALVRTGPGAGYPAVGALKIGSGNGMTWVYEIRNGWYRISYGGAFRWLEGWKTSGRL